MSHEMAKSKIDKSAESSGLCPKCSKSTGPGHLVEFLGCQVRFHKSCYILNGDLFKVYEDFVGRNEDFPFYPLCTECRDFCKNRESTTRAAADIKVTLHTDDMSKSIYDEDECPFRKNPFEVDNIIELILKGMNLEELKALRLVNNRWNKNATFLLSKQPSKGQDGGLKIKPIQICDFYQNKRENFLQVLRNSKNGKIFRKLQIVSLCEDERPVVWGFYDDILEIIDLTSFPELEIIIENHKSGREILSTVDFLSHLLNEISPYVVHLSVNIYILDPSLLDKMEFDGVKFLKLETLKFDNLQSSEWTKKMIENCPKLQDLHFKLSGENRRRDNLFFIDDYLATDNCEVLTQRVAQNLQNLDIRDTNYKFLQILKNFKMMKLKTFSLRTIKDIEDYILSYDLIQRAGPFLESQKNSLEIFKLDFKIQKYCARSDAIVDYINPNELQIDIPRLEHLQYFKLKFSSNDILKDTDEIWPVKEIKLPEIFPSLKKIFITYLPDWTLSFDSKYPCTTVQELVLHKWTDGDFSKIVELFPNVEHLKLDNFSYRVYEKLYTQISHIKGWEGTLKRIEISFRDYHLENFDIGNFSCLTELTSISFCQIWYCQEGDDTGGCGAPVFIYPNLTTIFDLPNLSKLSIKNFKISEDIIEECRRKSQNLDFAYVYNKK